MTCDRTRPAALFAAWPFLVADQYVVIGLGFGTAQADSSLQSTEMATNNGRDGVSLN